MSALTLWMDRTLYPSHGNSWDNRLFRERILDYLDGQRATGNGQRATGNGQRATGNGQRRMSLIWGPVRELSNI
jgi:hypothetical protein